jgi:hypothetical protein
MAFIVKRETTQPRSLIVKRDAIFKICSNVWSNTSGNFWNLINDPYDKTITDFNVAYNSFQVDINWGEGIDEYVPSNTNINHTFGITKSGISIFPRNGADLYKINCGTSSPKLGGTIDISPFPVLTDFTCVGNDITSFQGFANCTNLTTVTLTENKITGGFNDIFPNLSNRLDLMRFTVRNNLMTGTIPSLSALTNLVFFGCHANQLTGSIPSLSGLNNLEDFRCYYNYLTGSIPSLSGLTNLKYFYCSDQLGTTKLTGPIPSLSTNTALSIFSCQNNQLTGSIPSLSGLDVLTTFYCYTNQLTGFAGGPVSNTLGDFAARNNQLTSTAVNAILAAFVTANKTTDTRILNLGGAGNGAPIGQGITDKATLISRGWTVTTN